MDKMLHLVLYRERYNAASRQTAQF